MPPVEPEDSGVDKVVDWDDMEEAFDNGFFTCKADVKAWVRARFEECGVAFTNHQYAHVIAGLMPPYREIYPALPDSKQKLTEAIVVNIRSRHRAGERPGTIARDLGLPRGTVTDITSFRSWKQVAA